MLRWLGTLAVMALVGGGVYGSILFLLPSVMPVAAGLGAVSNVPSAINHQGIVTVSGKRFTGTGVFKFAIVDPDTGNNVWTNDGSKVAPPAQSGEPDNGVALAVADGVYSVALGAGPMTAISPGLFADGNLVLRIWFNDGTHNWQQLSPDHQLASVPYAMAIADGAVTTSKLAGGVGIPPGAMMAYAGSAAPEGWLFCDGSAMSRTAYAALFAAIGTSYGAGDGSTTFNLPDLRDRLPIGARQSEAGVPKTNVTGTLTQKGGQATHTLITAELPAHTHTGTTGGESQGHTHEMYASANCGTGGPGYRATWDGDCSGLNAYPMGISGGYNSNGHTHSFTTGSTGSGQAVSMMNPYMAAFYIIKY